MISMMPIRWQAFWHAFWCKRRGGSKIAAMRELRRTAKLTLNQSADQINAVWPKEAQE